MTLVYGDTADEADLNEDTRARPTLCHDGGEGSTGRKWLAVFTLIALLGFIAVIHAVNMTRLPGFVDDEGTYVSQAWSFQTEGHLSHYTYWYDHPPLGWMQLALYTFVTNGFARGPAVAVSREFMLGYAVISAWLVYVLARRLSLRRPTALLSVALFSLTPMAVEFQRLVMLDTSPRHGC